MRAEELKGHLDALLLAALEAGPRHGYAVIEALRQDTGGRLDLPTGTIYPALRRLEQAGLIAGSWSVVTGRRRRCYRLTGAGAAGAGGPRAAWREFAATVSAVLEGGPCRTRPITGEDGRLAGRYRRHWAWCLAPDAAADCWPRGRGDVAECSTTPV